MVFVTFLAECSNFANVFFEKLAVIVLKLIKINTYAIDLEKNKQPSYRLIYSLRLVKLNTLKTYIKINLVNDFIYLSKSLASAPILFDQKFNKNL